MLYKTKNFRERYLRDVLGLHNCDIKLAIAVGITFGISIVISLPVPSMYFALVPIARNHHVFFEQGYV